jgi:hypothetical protein
MAPHRELAERSFEAAFDIKPEERAAFLDRECNGDLELLARSGSPASRRRCRRRKLYGASDLMLVEGFR